MRVLMTADPIGGVWSYMLELCAGLGSHGVEVLLATLGGKLSRPQQKQVVGLSNIVLQEGHFRLEWMPDPWLDLEEAGEWLLGLERKYRPDVIHLNHLVHGDLPWSAPRLAVGHSCVLSWWAAVHGGPPPGQWETYRKRVTRSLRAAQCVIAPTRAMLIELHRYYGPLRNCDVILNGRQPSRCRPADKEPLILSAGRLWDQAKNVEALAAVAAHVEWPIHVAGAQMGPAGNTASLAGVRALGHLEPSELAQWYARAAIYALPARYEPFGLTALEAALCGCALVLGDIPSLHEVWGNAALYAAPDDHAGLRDRLNELTRDAAMRSEFAARAMARARRLSPQRLTNGYRAVYRRLVENHRADSGARPRAQEARLYST
jgi:glycosyltransferase involved in cell wall biosynthesis